MKLSNDIKRCNDICTSYVASVKTDLAALEV